MKFSYSAIWDDTVRLLRENAAVILALAGVFLFLPALLVGHFLPQPDVEPDRLFEALQTYFMDNINWLVIANMVNMTGSIAMLLLLLDGRGRTVGAAIVAAIPILLWYFIGAFLSTLIVLAGFIAFIIPGIYLFGRLSVLGPVMVAEERNPLRAIKRSFALTKAKGWAVVGLILLVALAGLILSFVVSAVLGSVFLIALGERIGGLLAVVLNALTSAAFSTVLIVLYAAIYRHLTAANAPQPIKGS